MYSKFFFSFSLSYCFPPRYINDTYLYLYYTFIPTQYNNIRYLHPGLVFTTKTRPITRLLNAFVSDHYNQNIYSVFVAKFRLADGTTTYIRYTYICVYVCGIRILMTRFCVIVCNNYNNNCWLQWMSWKLDGSGHASCVFSFCIYITGTLPVTFLSVKRAWSIVQVIVPKSYKS